MKLRSHIKTATGFVCVSTVLLPSHNDAYDEYETMVFQSDGKNVIDWMDITSERYRTAAVAEHGHWLICRAIEIGAGN